jgi:hypothetical protein
MALKKGHVDALQQTWHRFLKTVRDEGDKMIARGVGTDQETAEGLRHVIRASLHALQWRVDLADPDFPVLYRCGDDRLKTGPQNVDNSYFHGQLHGDATYRLHGEPGGREFVVTTREGDYSEIRTDQWLGERWSRDVVMNSDGSFDMTLGVDEKPGNWLPLRAGIPCTVFIREYFIDWHDPNIPGFFAVDRIDGPTLPSPLSMQRLANQLDDATEWLERLLQHTQRHYWAAFETDSETVNVIPAPAVTGAVGSPNIAYGRGEFHLAPGHVLLLQLKPPDAPYWGLATYNRWGEPPDFQNRQTSLNCKQVHLDSDGLVRIVVSPEDPGHPNWLDTEGCLSGSIWYRCFAGQGNPLPPVSTVVQAEMLWDHLPSDTPKVGVEARRSQLAVRRRYVARRYQR